MMTEFVGNYPFEILFTFKLFQTITCRVNLCCLLSVFEEAVSAAGWDFHSDRLWDLYAEWEKEQNNLTFMTSIYDRVLSVPTHYYNTHYEKYAMLVL